MPRIIPKFVPPPSSSSVFGKLTACIDEDSTVAVSDGAEVKAELIALEAASELV